MTLLDGFRQFCQAVGIVTLCVILGAVFFTLLMPTDELNDVLNGEDEHEAN